MFLIRVCVCICSPASMCFMLFFYTLAHCTPDKLLLWPCYEYQTQNVDYFNNWTCAYSHCLLISQLCELPALAAHSWLCKPESMEAKMVIPFLNPCHHIWFHTGTIAHNLTLQKVKIKWGCERIKRNLGLKINSVIITEWPHNWNIYKYISQFQVSRLLPGPRGMLTSLHQYLFERKCYNQSV